MLIMVRYLQKYVELTRPKIKSRDPIFFTGTRGCSWVSGIDQSGTIPNLVAKILATNFGVFYVKYMIYVMFCSM